MGQFSAMKQRIKSLRGQLSCGLIERDEVVRLALLSALAGEHLLLIGEPGTAKSVLARKLHLAFRGGEYFERLLTKFSVPEELFGPLSIKALENDCYLRLTERYLPAASIAFIDEIFKANSAILNALLTLLNEREFDNGDARHTVPLISVIAASNELPDDEGLEALYDRFLCRYLVKPVSAQHFADLLQLQETPGVPDENLPFTHPELAAIQYQSAGVELPDEVIRLLQSLREYLQQQQLYVSDRRWRKVVKLLKVAALTNGQTQVSVWDCYLLQHCLWHEPQQQRLIADWYRTQVGMSGQLNLQSLEKLVATWEQVLREDMNSEVQCRDDQQRLLYLDRLGQLTTDDSTRELSSREGEPLYLAPPDQDNRSGNGKGYSKSELREQFFDDYYRQTHINGHWVHFEEYIANPENRCFEYFSNRPYMEAKQHSAAFIDGRIKETGNLVQEIALLQESLKQQMTSLDQVIGDHLWLLPSFADLAAASLNDALVKTDSLLSRLKTVMDGYRQLPRK